MNVSSPCLPLLYLVVLFNIVVRALLTVLHGKATASSVVRFQSVTYNDVMINMGSTLSDAGIQEAPYRANDIEWIVNQS